jgi:predicted GNAT superfamily acetyltransferase
MVEYLAFQTLDMDRALLSGMLELHDSIFDGQNSGTILEELGKRSRFLILLAVVDGRVVGYKVGYEERTNRFYSWLGGVHPEYRNRGIASELMRRQHAWCEQQGYSVIRTHTKNKWRNMLILNIRHGFDIIGTYTDGKGEPKIILEKRLR